MQTLFENEFITIKKDATHNILETTWITTVDMGQETYREVCKKFLKEIETHQPKGVLVDAREANYVIIPEDQDWLNAHIYPKTFEAGVQKLAFLMAKDFFLQMSLEQTVDDSNTNKEIAQNMQQQFFGDYEEAMAWLKGE